MTELPVYLDCNATTPVENEVVEAMVHYLSIEYGNAGSRTHRYGLAAQKAVKRAREQVAAIVDAQPEEVVFTSGATESNNLAIFGLVHDSDRRGRRHVVSSMIEHKAVLEPMEQLSARGFEVTLVPPRPNGVVDPDAVKQALRDDTFLVSIMHVNNETGAIQPLRDIAEVLRDHPAAFHTDAAQGFGKEFEQLMTSRVDLIGVSAHKIFGPKGIGVLIVRRNERTNRLQPLMYGGGQESGLRPGTTPVHLAVGLGVAAEMARRDFHARRSACEAFRRQLLEALAPLNPTIHGDDVFTLPHVVNLRFRDIDSEAVILVLKDLAAISNGSACTSTTYRPSHVLKAMGLTDDLAECATRWSWCHLTPQPKWSAIVSAIRALH